MCVDRHYAAKTRTMLPPHLLRACLLANWRILQMRGKGYVPMLLAQGPHRQVVKTPTA